MASDAICGKDTFVSVPLNNKALATHNALQLKQQPLLVKLLIPDIKSNCYYITSTPKVTLYIQWAQKPLQCLAILHCMRCGA